MKRIIYIYIVASLFSCMPEERLPIKDTGEISGYFIECYCIPDEPYSLNAAKIQPLTEVIDSGAAVNLTITIQADSAIRLHPVYANTSLFKNYRHVTPLPNHGIDSLYLNIRTPENKYITAKTSVPDAIEISSYSVSRAAASATITFHASRDPGQNYYLFSIQARKDHSDDPLLKKESTFLDLSHYSPGASIEKTIKCPQIEEADAVLITLIRITKDCYHYQVSLYEANSANQGSITTPVPLAGNIHGALGIFTCYTKCHKFVPRERFQ